MKRNTNLNIKRISQNSCGFNIYQIKKSYSNYGYMAKNITVLAVESFEYKFILTLEHQTDFSIIRCIFPL